MNAPVHRQNPILICYLLAASCSDGNFIVDYMFENSMAI